MRPIRLDAHTADRLLSGEVSSDDAPPGYAGVAHLLEAAGAGLGAHESMREPAMATAAAATAATAATAAAMQAAGPGHLGSIPAHQEKKMLPKILTIKAAAVAVVLLGASSAAAATGSLPGGVQNTASVVLAKVGISVPGPNDGGKGHAGTHGKSGGHSHHGHGPNAHATHGLCTAAAAHARSGHHPNAHATVFPSTTTCTSGTLPGQQGTGSSSDQGNGPNGNALFGLCTAAEAHADSGHQPNAHATVFPPLTTCTSVPHPGQGSGNSAKPDDTSSTSTTSGASSTTTEDQGGPSSSTPASPHGGGKSHG